MENKKIPTIIGTIILIIIGITAGMFVWQYEKNQPLINQSPVKTSVKRRIQSTLIPEKQIQSNFQENENVINISTWKIYRNDKLGLEFKYPNDWRVRNDDSIETALEIYPETSDNYHDDSFIYLIMFPSDKALGPGPTIEEYKDMFSDKSIECSKSSLLDYHRETKNCNLIKVDNKEALSYEFSNDSKKFEKETDFIMKNSKFLGLRIQTGTINGKNIYEIYDQLINTIVFTD